MDQIVQFGPERRLVGVLSGVELPANAPMLVLPSAGLLPRAGPFRLHVELAQRLVPQGIRTFRFEVPGVGETPRFAGYGSREATLAALDQLSSEYGCQKFIVGGVCSAADIGWSTALVDNRVCGLVMLDGLSFIGPWFHVARMLNFIQRPPGEWWQVWRRWMGRRALKASPKAEMADYREWPDRAEAKHQFSALLDRNVHSLWIYTGGYSDLFLHSRQFAWSFGSATANNRVVMYYWPDCDHTFYARVHRDRLLATLEQWLAAVTEPSGALP